MKLKSILSVACAATMMFASCSNEDNANEFIKGDKDAHLNVAIAFPKVDTRNVVDGNATTEELKVTDVTVFIFENGVAAPGNAQTLGVDKFDASTDNVYKLKEENKILTTNGTKNIYVGINLPTSMQSFTTETALVKAVAVNASDLQGKREGILKDGVVSGTFKTLRLADGRSPRLSLSTTNNGTTEVLFAGNLIEMIKKAYPAQTDYSNFFDQTHVFDITLDFDVDLGVTVTINGWQFKHQSQIIG